jgi:hypothetical protein
MQTRGGRRPGPATTRVRMRKAKGPTNMWDAERAVDSYDTTAELPGSYTRLRGRRETDGGSGGEWSAVIDWLPDGEDKGKNGRAIVMGVDYGILRREAPRRTGSDSFDGFHGITLTATRKRRGRRQVRVYDSLNDGRTRDVPGPGPVWISEDKVRPAAFAYGKAVHGKPNRVAAVFLPPGDQERPEPPEPKPDPCVDYQDAMVEAIIELEEWLDDMNSGQPGQPVGQSVIQEVVSDLRKALPGNAAHADDLVQSGLAERD